ncbi:MAG TPA: helix-turn-helix domain-containing protein [Candidatus Limnocylindrales bacterium]|nr:helix-turn-helix domain-containing protein [Candidatus Limnocylindrales bacterium]
MTDQLPDQLPGPSTDQPIDPTSGRAGAPDAGRRPPPVGRQIRRWRTDRGMTLARLAAASNLNVGYLSQIENDKASPSLACLSALAGALDVPAAWFLVDESKPPEVQRAADRRWREEAGGRASRVDARGSTDVTIVEAQARPGTSTGLHTHPGDEHHVILSGRFRMSQGEHVVEVGPGDYVRWDGLVPHDSVAIGDEPGSMLIIRLNRHGEPHD